MAHSHAGCTARIEESFANPKPADKAPGVDEYTLDLLAEKVGQVLDERERRKKRVER
jgi:hypothetical protein